MRHGMTDDEDFTPDPRDLTDGEILERLSDGGIEITIDDFKAEAMKAGSPEMLAGNWAYMYGVRSGDEDSFLYSAIFELWRRHLGYEKRTPEIVAEFIDDIFNTYEESPEAHEKYFLLNIYERVREFYHKLLKEDGSPDVDLYNDMTWYARNDFDGFLLSIPHELSRHGLTDQAVNIGRWFSALSGQPQNFLRDTACILADAGRREEAMIQIEENIMRFPEDMWVIINAGDAMYSLGEKESAERYFLRAKNMVVTKSDHMVVLERLLDLYRELGMKDRAKVIESEITALELPLRKNNRNN
ncbi:MAG TPA: hypothetical protein VJZ24_01420 [Thermodesulfovibrionales bacterium]|nr:hypothetical protein [Thermodesulfovibrionales bacterium]